MMDTSLLLGLGMACCSIGELDVLGVTYGKDSDDDQVNKSSQKSNQKINELCMFNCWGPLVFIEY